MMIRGNYMFYIVIMSVFVSFAFGEAIVFNLPFLQLVPPLECFIDGGWQECNAKDACANNSIMRPVHGHKYHL